MKLTSLTHLGFLINWIIDERPATDLSFQQVHAAAREGRLIELLARRYGHIADFYYLRPRPGNLINLEQMEAALSDAACALEGREPVAHSGLCLALAIVLEAIQQRVRSVPPFACPAEQLEL